MKNGPFVVKICVALLEQGSGEYTTRASIRSAIQQKVEKEQARMQAEKEAEAAQKAVEARIKAEESRAAAQREAELFILRAEAEREAARKAEAAAREDALQQEEARLLALSEAEAKFAAARLQTEKKFVNSVTQQSFVLSCAPEDFVSTARVQVAEHFECFNPKLVCNGNILHDKTWADYTIPPNCSIYVLPELKPDSASTNTLTRFWKPVPSTPPKTSTTAAASTYTVSLLQPVADDQQPKARHIQPTNLAIIAPVAPLKQTDHKEGISSDFSHLQIEVTNSSASLPVSPVASKSNSHSPEKRSPERISRKEIERRRLEEEAQETERRKLAFLAAQVEYFESLEANRRRETRAAILIQKVYRGHAVRKRNKRENVAALQIQKIWRGYSTRKALKVKAQAAKMRPIKQPQSKESKIIMEHFLLVLAKKDEELEAERKLR
jgi:hypothetical protein